MKVYINEKIEKNFGTCLALGSFDALHTAHMKLINTAVSYAKDHNLMSGVYQFEERPEFVLRPDESNKIIYTNAHKIKILRKTGVDFLYFEKFDDDFMRLSGREFAKMLAEKFNVRCVVVGFHYRFGYKGLGDCELLKELGKEFGFEVIVIDPVKHKDILVSSTHIRSLIADGNIGEAGEFLSRPYSIYADVVHDRGVGKAMLKIPTANLKIDQKLLLPNNGVYATYISYKGKEYASVTNIGIRPTFDLDKISVETHILNFAGEIYDEKIELFFIGKIRNEIKFENSDQLRAQILSDIDKANLLFSSNFKI